MHLPKLVLLLSAVLLIAGHADDQASAPENRGTITGSTYRNPALGMTISLPPGEWRFRGRATGPADRSSRGEHCEGPLCGKPQVNLVFADESTGTTPRYSVFLSAFKLRELYRNRERYSLKNFAKIMMEDSIAGSGWIPDGEMTFLTLDGNPAYRLLLRKGFGKLDRAVGYVSESNDFVFLLIGVSTVDERPLQSALESIAISGSVPVVRRRTVATAWKEYAYPSVGFAVTFPHDPDPHPDLQIPEMTSYTVSPGTGTQLTLRVSSRARDCAATLGELRQSVSAGRRPGFDASSLKELRVGGHPGIEYEYNANDGRSYDRYVCANGRFFVFSAGWPTGQARPAAVVRIVNSLRFFNAGSNVKP